MTAIKTRPIIMVTWAESGWVDLFKNLKSFTDKYPCYSYNTINNYLSRKGEPYQDESVKIERRELL